MHPLFDGADYRVEVTIVKPDAEDRDVHIPVLGDDPYVTIEMTRAPESAADAGGPLLRIRTSGLGTTPRTLGEVLSLVGAQLQQVPDAG